MSTHTGLLPLSGLGLAALLTIASVPSAAADGPQSQSQTKTKTQTSASRADTPRERIILFKNGQLLRGLVTEDDRQYHVTQRIGTIHLPKSGVEGLFDSIQRIYQYKVEQLPERDTFERMKLVHWCQNQMLREEAKQQLREILVISPKHTQAEAMLASMEQTDTLITDRRVDPEVRQTRGTETSMTADRPESLDTANLARAQRAMGISGFPVIFDLPRPAAIKRSQEFVQIVHPILQKKCARCHDAEYRGSFQLVTMKTRADRTVEAYRSNLDSVLRLIDQETPAKSELLSSTLRPHGTGPDKKPIFLGWNDPSYQILSKWVYNVCQSKSAPVATATGRPTDPADPSEPAFAVERIQSKNALTGLDATGKLTPPGTIPPAAAGLNRDILPPRQYRELAGAMVEEDPAEADPKEFPLPYAITGVKPPVPGEKTIKPPVRNLKPVTDPKPPTTPRTDRDPAVTPTSATTPKPPTKEEEAALEAAIKALPKNTKKSVKINPDVLQKLLNRAPGTP